MTTALQPTGLPGSDYGAFEGKPYARASSHQTGLSPMGVPGGGYGSFEGRLSLTTSIRMAIQLALVARLAALGWLVQLRDVENAGDAPVKAIVFQGSEDKRIENNDQYQATLQVAVEITVRAQDAHPTTDAGNAYRYLDRMVTLAETTIHSPDAWGLHPDFTDVTINGHDVSDPTERNEVQALLRLQFKYRHDYQNPEA